MFQKQKNSLLSLLYIYAYFILTGRIFFFSSLAEVIIGRMIFYFFKYQCEEFSFCLKIPLNSVVWRWWWCLFGFCGGFFFFFFKLFHKYNQFHSGSDDSIVLVVWAFGWNQVLFCQSQLQFRGKGGGGCCGVGKLPWTLWSADQPTGVLAQTVFLRQPLRSGHFPPLLWL